MKLNNKGMSIIEIIVTFSLIMIMVIGMFSIVLNYRDKASYSLKKLDMDTFKNTLTKDIQNDIIKRGVKEINTNGECSNIASLNKCINIVFKDDSEKAFGTSLVNPNDRTSVEEKYLYYDGEKYRLRDNLPEIIPEGRNILDFQVIKVLDDSILTSDSTTLADGTVIKIYKIDVFISRAEFDEDFGIHIVASTEDIES